MQWGTVDELMIVGHGLFHVANTPTATLSLENFAVDHKTAITYLGAGLTAITISHYWVDQHLWRFRSPERRWFARLRVSS